MRKFWRRFYFSLFSALFGVSVLSAQVSADPNDPFYGDLPVWETMGLVNHLPAARPYPMNVVEEILQTVIDRAPERERRVALAHYKRLFGKSFTIGAKVSATLDTDLDRQLDISVVSADFNHYLFRDLLSVSGSFDLWATNRLPDEEVRPAFTSSAKDVVADNSHVGPFWVLPSFNSSVSFGTTDVYLIAGLMRGSYGPFHADGVVAGSGATHSGQLSFAFRRENWTFNSSLYGLSATRDADYNAGVSMDDLAYYPEKFLAVHSLDFHPFDWLSVSFLESVMYGGRIEPMYMLPLTVYFLNQGLTGFNDNSYMGAMFTVKPAAGWKIDGVLYADDLSFNDIATFHWDTKWRLAAQLGVSYAPSWGNILSLISFNYTMVTPYTYAHKESDARDYYAPNYQNYLHAGVPFGANLEPNSDRFTLLVKTRPLECLDVDFVGTLIRHGNVNENMEWKFIREYLTSGDTYITDGSMANASATGAGHARFYDTPFLTQDTIRYIWQFGFDANCRLPVLKSGGYMVFRLSYRFEADRNADVGTGIFTNTIPGETDEAVIRQEAENQLAAWRNRVSGTTEFNNYISVGFEYFY